MTFRRTVVVETELGSRRILPGDKPSGNRDPEVLAEPERFDLSRVPNPHVGLGGGGVHYCLGSHLATTTLRELFGQLLAWFPDFEVGEPDVLGTNFHARGQEAALPIHPLTPPPLRTRLPRRDHRAPHGAMP
jgi:cytochrome P450